MNKFILVFQFIIFVFLWNISSKIDENQQANEKMKDWYVSTSLDIWEKVMLLDLKPSVEMLSYAQDK